MHRTSLRFAAAIGRGFGGKRVVDSRHTGTIAAVEREVCGASGAASLAFAGVPRQRRPVPMNCCADVSN